MEEIQIINLENKHKAAKYSSGIITKLLSKKYCDNNPHECYDFDYINIKHESTYSKITDFIKNIFNIENNSTEKINNTEKINSGYGWVKDDVSIYGRLKNPYKVKIIIPPKTYIHQFSTNEYHTPINNLFCEKGYIENKYIANTFGNEIEYKTNYRRIHYGPIFNENLKQEALKMYHISRNPMCPDLPDLRREFSFTISSKNTGINVI